MITTSEFAVIRHALTHAMEFAALLRDVPQRPVDPDDAHNMAMAAAEALDLLHGRVALPADAA